MAIKITVENTIPHMVVHWVGGREILASSGYSIFLSENGGATFDKVTDLPGCSLINEISKLRILSRAFRLGIRTLRKFESGTILAAADRKLYRIANNQINVTYSFDKGFGPLREGWCEDKNGNFYMAEYFLNNKRTSTNELLKSCDDGRSWEVVRTLDEIRHIHFVQYDPFSGDVYMGTGDKDDESTISCSPDGGSTWTVLGSGDQEYRAVSLLFDESYIYWGGDAPTRQNYIVRYNRTNKVLERLVAVKGTVFYSTILENGIKLFGTTDEGSSEGQYPAGDRRAHIWGSHDGVRWEELISWQKDLWPYILGFGTVLFAHGKSQDNVYFTTEALSKMDEVLICAKLATDNN